MSNLQEYTNKIINWAKERELTTADPVKQMYKLVEEFGETAEGIVKDRPADIKDGIGDMFVVLTIMREQLKECTPKKVNSNKDYVFFNLLHNLGKLSNFTIYGMTHSARNKIYNMLINDLEDLANSLNLDLTNCVAQAYNEIKDRKGKMVNGVFVKSEDL